MMGRSLGWHTYELSGSALMVVWRTARWCIGS